MRSLHISTKRIELARILFSIGIHAVHLKYRLRNIETNRANFAHGRLPSMWFALTQPPYGTSMPQRGRRPQHHLQTFAR